MSRAAFFVEGAPVGKGRPRFSSGGAYVRTYTPKKTADYEKHVRMRYIAMCNSTQLNGPLRAEITCVFKIPKSTTKANRERMLRGEILPTVKPDADNIAKTILDALNGLAYEDDKQITALKVNKVYGEEPCVNVILEELL
ncbi:MAG: RusA family crossover junction endodeoxyribonuclease [Clostridia bacterium]|nr:RusA family crossover junction endodeoxyribonuclease [Clostridia bacterium]